MANSRYTIIIQDALKELDVTVLEYCIADTVFKLSADPNATQFGWCYATREYLGACFGIGKKAAIKAVSRLINKGLVERDSKTKRLRITSLWYKTTVYQQKEIEGGEKQPKGVVKPPNNNNSLSLNSTLLDSNSSIPKSVLDMVIKQYIKAKNWESTISLHKELWSNIYRRNGKAAKELFLLAQGDQVVMVEAIDYVAEKSRQQGGWDWTLETVCKKFIEYRASKEEKPEGAAGREL